MTSRLIRTAIQTPFLSAMGLFAVPVMGILWFFEYAPRDKPGPPIIRIAPQHRDLGPFVEGDDRPRETDFTLANIGGTPLQILEVLGSCNCATVMLSDKTIQPGAAAVLRVRLRPEGKTGVLSASIDVRSNDDQHPSVRLTVTWEVHGSIVCDPPAPILQSEEGGNCGGLTKVLTHVPGRICASDIEVAASWPKGVTATFEQFAPEPGESPDAPVRLGTVLIHVSRELDANRGCGFVQLRVRGLPDPFSIPFTWVRPTHLRSTPTILFFGSVRPGMLLKRRLEVSRTDGEEFGIAGTEASNQAISITHQGQEVRAKSHDLTVELIVPAAAGPYRESVSVRSDIAGSSPLVVHLAGVVREE